MSDLYKKAAQEALRFQTSKGLLTVEDLFSLPLQSTANRPNLDAIAVDLHNELKGSGQVSFVTNKVPNARQKTLELSLEVVKDVIATVEERNRLELDKRNRADRKQKILDIINKKTDEALSAASVEDLKAELAALG